MAFDGAELDGPRASLSLASNGLDQFALCLDLGDGRYRLAPITQEVHDLLRDNLLALRPVDPPPPRRRPGRRDRFDFPYPGDPPEPDEPDPEPAAAMALPGPRVVFQWLYDLSLLDSPGRRHLWHRRRVAQWLGLDVALRRRWADGAED